MYNKEEPRLLQVGDEIVRFEVGRRVGNVQVISSVTKTLAKSGHYTFLRETVNYRKPDDLDEENQAKLITGVKEKGERGWSTKYFFLIEKGSDPR